MNYQDMLRALAVKKLAQQNSDQDFQDEESQPIEEPISPSIDENEDDTLVAGNSTSNKRTPASTNSLPISGKDVQELQNLGIIDKVKMKHLGLDPWNPDDVHKYKMSQGNS